MPQSPHTIPPRTNRPDNAEHEIRLAYRFTIETNVVYSGTGVHPDGLDPKELRAFYRHAFQSYREGRLLAAERWARATRHLAHALWYEAKIAYLEPRSTELPFLEGATPDEYDVRERSNTTEDLLDSLEGHIPQDRKEIAATMSRYLARAREHLAVLERPDYDNELLRAERTKAAYEYGRTIECIALADEAERRAQRAA